jgi:hypothetical protein
MFIVLRNPSLSAAFEPENLGLNGKHDKHYNTKSDMEVVVVTTMMIIKIINFRVI